MQTRQASRLPAMHGPWRWCCTFCCMAAGRSARRRCSSGRLGGSGMRGLTTVVRLRALPAHAALNWVQLAVFGRGAHCATALLQLGDAVDWESTPGTMSMIWICVVPGLFPLCVRWICLMRRPEGDVNAHAWGVNHMCVT